jgi:predicted protein tyrosine phosphatase
LRQNALNPLSAERILSSRRAFKIVSAGLIQKSEDTWLEREYMAMATIKLRVAHAYHDYGCFCAAHTFACFACAISLLVS